MKETYQLFVHQLRKTVKQESYMLRLKMDQRTEMALLEDVGFSVSKHIFKKTYFGFRKYHITE